MLRAKLATLQGHLESAETEQKTNRETIYRMMNDQQNMSELGLQTDNLRVVTFRSREKNLHVRLTVNSICLIFCFDDLQYSVQWFSEMTFRRVNIESTAVSAPSCWIRVYDSRMLATSLWIDCCSAFRTILFFLAYIGYSCRSTPLNNTSHSRSVVFVHVTNCQKLAASHSHVSPPSGTCECECLFANNLSERRKRKKRTWGGSTNWGDIGQGHWIGVPLRSMQHRDLQLMTSVGCQFSPMSGAGWTIVTPLTERSLKYDLRTFVPVKVSQYFKFPVRPVVLGTCLSLFCREGIELNFSVVNGTDAPIELMLLGYL